MSPDARHEAMAMGGAMRRARARCVWLRGVVGWGVTVAVLWSAGMGVLFAHAEQTIPGLTAAGLAKWTAAWLPFGLLAFPACGYLWGRHRWEAVHRRKWERSREADRAEARHGGTFESLRR